MINKKDILKPFAALTVSRVIFDKRLIYPVRDWLLCLFLFCLVVIGGVAQSAYTFVSYRNISVEGGNTEELQSRYNQTQVQKSLAIYRQRSAAFNELQQTIPAVYELQTASTTDQVAEEEAVEQEALPASVEMAI